MTKKEFNLLSFNEQITLFLNWCKEIGKEPKKHTTLQEFISTLKEEE